MSYGLLMSNGGRGRETFYGFAARSAAKRSRRFFAFAWLAASERSLAIFVPRIEALALWASSDMYREIIR